MWIGGPPRSPVLAPFVELIGYSEGVASHRYERVLPTGSADLMINLHADRIWTHDGSPNIASTNIAGTSAAGTSLAGTCGAGMGGLAGASAVPGSSGMAGTIGTGDLEPTGGRQVGGAVFGAPSAEPVVIDTADQRAILFVGLRPGAAYHLFGSAIAHADGELVELDTLWDGTGRTVREQLLAEPGPEPRLRLIERLLVDRLVTLPDPDSDDRAIRFAAAAFERGATVSSVTDALGWTAKRFIGRFTARVGLPPKRYARVRRLQRVLRTVTADPDTTRLAGPDLGRVNLDRTGDSGFDSGKVDWARVAYEHGFYDQSHLVNDFKALTGCTPTAYHPRSPRERNHIPLLDPDTTRGTS